jgi:hypothetical protein
MKDSETSPRAALQLQVELKGEPQQVESLLALQRAFSEVCNALAPLVQKTRCWNRVTLHHLAYRDLRNQFPAMGSQMVCNAIYSVSRTSRMLFQHPGSPFHITRLEGKALPLLHFTETCPVYFDRHTLSVKDGRLSMYTLDGRVRFDLALGAEHELAFHQKKLREVVLNRTREGGFQLNFHFSDGPGEPVEAADEPGSPQIPEYVVIEETS